MAREQVIKMVILLGSHAGRGGCESHYTGGTRPINNNRTLHARITSSRFPQFQCLLCGFLLRISCPIYGNIFFHKQTTLKLRKRK